MSSRISPPTTRRFTRFIAPEPQQAFVVVDLTYGDAGKGTVVDFLARRCNAHTVVRFNGGAQAAHNVIAPDGRHHTFAQFGSGSLVPGVRTHLSQHMLVDPYALFNEEAGLRRLGVNRTFERLTLDRRALIISPYQQIANRLRELARGDARHGSCGLGIGETMADALQQPDRVIRAGDLPDRRALRRKLHNLREMKRAELAPLLAAVRHMPEAQRDLAALEDDNVLAVAADNFAYLAEVVQLVDADYLRDLLRRPGTVIFEGAQGVLLDQDWGFHPYTTWSTTTTANADGLLAESDYDGQITRLGVVRTTFTRHGAGPFVSEVPGLESAIPEAHNATNPWQQHFRLGWFDAVAARYARTVAGSLDALAVTHVDRLASLPRWKIVEAYRYDGPVGDLPRYFAHNGQLISAIRAAAAPDLDHQAGLTQRLFRCEPIHVTLEGSDSTLAPEELAAREYAYVERLGRILELPVALTSYGPSAIDKRVAPAWSHRLALPHAAR